jgi:hypothetical protein
MVSFVFSHIYSINDFDSQARGSFDLYNDDNEIWIH